MSTCGCDHLLGLNKTEPQRAPGGTLVSPLGLVNSTTRQAPGSAKRTNLDKEPWTVPTIAPKRSAGNLEVNKRTRWWSERGVSLEERLNAVWIGVQQRDRRQPVERIDM